MESDVDSEGEDLEIIRPCLIQELRNILDEYPDDGQILKELIQNAEDAGARKVKILTDNRSFHHQLEPHEVKKHPHLKVWQGPALCVYNDAQFKDKDWEGIRMLHMSVKEKDPLKVGRFGLGFKSVFHMTDGLAVLSGDKIMYMDPFKPEHRYCKMTWLAGKDGGKLKSLLACLEGVFGITKDTFSVGSGGFQGTLFWFPLRQSGSELSSTVYSQAKVQRLIAAFQAEASSLLLFLNSISRVEIYTRGEEHGQTKLFSVGLAASCCDQVYQQRMKFLTTANQGGEDLPDVGCYCQTEVIMETAEFCGDEHEQLGRKSQQWSVAIYHPGQQELSEELKQLCADPELSYRPFVGVAVPLTNRCSFQSQLFCFLPLPLDTHSPTGLPVHVHGYFAVSQNRRHLKWPTADQLGQDEQLEAPLRWNCLLVKELLPRVYGALLDRLKSLEEIDPQLIYSTWPDGTTVDDRWKPLLCPLYTALCSQSSFYSHSQGSQWVNLNQAVVEELSQPVLRRLAEDMIGEEEIIRVKRSVARVYSMNGEKLVQLPDHVQHTLGDFGLLKSMEIMTGECVHSLLPSFLSLLSDDDKLHVLHFLCCHDNVLDLLRGQQLLPLADGTFATFQNLGVGCPVIRLCPDNLLTLFPGLESQFCDNRVSLAVKKSLRMVASSAEFAFQTLEEDDGDIPELIEKSLHTRFGDQQPSLPHDDIWIKQIWEFLTSKELNHYSHLNLLPEMRDGDVTLLPLSGIYVCSSVKGLAPLSTELISCLLKLRVKVLSGLPDFVTSHKDVLGRWVFFPSPEGLMAALKCVSDNATIRRLATENFNASASAEEKEALVTLLVNTKIEAQQMLGMLQQLKLFSETLTGDAVSVDEVSVIAPDILPPIMPQQRMLSCSHNQRLAALVLGSCEATVLEIVTEVIQLIHQGTYKFPNIDIITLMEFVFSHDNLTNDATFLELLRCVELIPTSTTQLKLACELYDPTSLKLNKLFLAEDKFPSDSFVEPGILSVLKELGLRGEDSIDLNDIVKTSKVIEDLWMSEEKETAKEKAEGLLEMLFYHGQQLDAETLGQISNRQCLPCEDNENRPSFYPSSLPYSPSPKLARPQDMCHHSQAQLIGSVLPIISVNLPEAVAQGLQVNSQIHIEHVLQNLDNVLSYYHVHEASQYRLILSDIFHFLGQHVSDPTIVQTLHEKECVLLESGDRFAKPCAFWVEKSDEDIQLNPYRFPLPGDMQNDKELLLACGAARHQDTSLLHAVLLQIQLYHSQHTRSQSDFNHDFIIVEQILDVLSKSDSASDGTTLLPVLHSEPNVLCFQQAKNCTVLSYDGLFNVSSFTDDEDIFIVHEKVHQGTAVALGALKMKDRALTGVEDLDFDYEQQEELTSRLQDLLMNSYTDGFSVPKELIQNADDAGATEVCFLLDERENEDARKNLITDAMDSLQGPAFWAYNNATFSDEDFENIKKLGEGTKKDDASKVGQFGLGFNSVYNLTDVPSFISRHTMAMFDPHKKYLKGKAGLRMDFRRIVNRTLLSRMPHQFKPFQGVFGCELQSNDDVNYTGTLFRFPLRTKEQAATSKIQNDSYDKNKRRDFLRMLLERAGNLLMFTQKVNKIKIFYLPPYSTDPSSPQCLLDLSKSSHRHVLQLDTQLGDQSVLQYFTAQWPANTNIQILEDVKIEMKVTEHATTVCAVEPHNSTTQWRLAWASGIAQSAMLAHQNRQERVVPLATVAALLGESGLSAIKDSPPGYYKSGHIFCFMPLPERMVLDDLLVHVNATFALSSSRRNLLSHSDEDLDNKGATWNTALIADAVSRAYLLMLQNIQSEAAMDTDFEHFFQLWPVSGEPDLVDNFYRLTMTDRNKVIPVPVQDKWIAASDACFLEPSFRKSECGETAWTIVRDYWGKGGHLVDVPADVFLLLPGIKEEHVITMLEFYRDIFLPNIELNCFEVEDRDRLVLHALTRMDDISTLIPQYACIPCTSWKEIIFETMAIEDMTNQNQNFSSESSLKRIGDLYDPTSIRLQKLFLTEKKFPFGDFMQSSILQVLKGFGMNEERSVRSQDLIETAKLIEKLWNHEQQAVALQKAEGLWEILVNHGQSFGEGVLRTLSTIQCLPCVQQEEKPELYPPSLPYCCTDKLVRPQEMCLFSQTHLAGSQLPTMRQTLLLEKIAEELNVGSKVNPELVLEHLQCVINNYESKDAKLYKFILSDIFQFLGQNISDYIVSTLRETKCVLTQYGDCFAKPADFWVDRVEDNIDLAPYRYLLPHDFQSHRDLFIACGSSLQQTSKPLLLGVLGDIQNVHSGKERSSPEYDHDLNIVSQILDVMVKNKLAAADGSNPLPIYHSELAVLHFKEAKDCTLVPIDVLADDPFFTEDEEIFIVHPRIHQDTAVALGALKMKDRALTGVEDLDFDYEQQEELTNRLQDLLMNSYTDGFSVPKELIQNADDAGATEVCFLLDERENEDARKNLITDAMDSLQGPAFWAYNNATFSDEDFENIKKLGEGTKKEDTTKVGHFGLGFNSVYNLTDVPSFISRHTMAMFDPHKKYLKGKAGLRLDFSRKVNLNLLSRMPNQFKPFQGVFGCHLLKDTVDYNGTLFRFPLRTAVQAEESKIKKESYSKGKRQEFLKILLDRAGSVLTFTQNVKSVKVFYLHSDCTDPSSPQCLLDLTKTSKKHGLQPQAQPVDQSILQYFTSKWSSSTNIQILENVKIEMKVTEHATTVCEVEAHNSTTQWRLAWASGIGQSAALSRKMSQEGLVPLAAVAALIEAGVLQTVQNSPQGFYKTSRYFCFLPLPENKANEMLPVHMNATFALKSSRCSMLTSTDEDLDNKGAAWNSALIADAVTRAYLLLLENVQNETAMDTDFKHFFHLWPVTGETLLVRNFFRCLVNDRNKVFPVSENIIHWMDFTEVWFMDQQFRKSACGNTAWQAMQHFWNRDGHLVDIPTEVYSAFEHSEQTEQFKERVITAEMFYRELFFPNIASSYWQQQDRDELVYHALLEDKLREFLRGNPCIPCAGTNSLKQPDELIHPNREASVLYSLLDGFFPQGHQIGENMQSSVNFCSESSLKCLHELGMITDELPSEMLLERATSASKQLTETDDSVQLRPKRLIEYLSTYTGKGIRIKNYPEDALNKLSKIKFLPVLKKPSKWPFPWAAQDMPQLAPPCELYSGSFTGLVGCHQIVVDSNALHLASYSCMKLDVLKSLGLKTEEHLTIELFKLSVQQLHTVAHATNENPSEVADWAQSVCCSIYSYLTKYVEHDKEAVIEQLSNKDVVWTKAGFVKPSDVAVSLNFDCEPYRFKLENTFVKFLPFLKAVGVNDTFDAANLTSLIEEVYNRFDGTPLPDEIVHLVSRAAQMLAQSLQSTNSFTENPVYLPDHHKYMKPTCSLCLDDCEWLKESENMTFVNNKIPNDTAKMLGVKSKRSKDLESLGDLIPFGQSEKLTDRIKRLLDGYTLDSSLFKELLQNADDAGATEIKFIKDWRHLDHEKVLEGCEALQGPSLCVFNNKSFTKEDMEGIQNLGRGSKGQDALKTGQFGVGFNAVYNITDVPSFWTLEDDVKETLCILDPNCRYIPNSRPDKPGLKVSNMERIRNAYPDMFAGYLDTAFDMTLPGTLFRFPLRTEEMAKHSDIKKEAVTEDNMNKLLKDFQKEMSICLLFLNNLAKIGIYSVTDDGHLELENEVRMDTHDKYVAQDEHFKQHLKHVSKSVHDKTTILLDIPAVEACSLKMIHTSNGHKEEWLIVQRVGFKNTRNVSEELKLAWQKDSFWLLPRGGVAVKLAKGVIRPLPNHQAFCILPLPVNTNLPVHVNGHFALDHETRRNLWDSKEDIKTEWNKMIADEVIVPAYLSALQFYRDEQFSHSEDHKQPHFQKRLEYYHSLFPNLDLETASTPFWTAMRKKLYTQIAEQELPLFPVLHFDQLRSIHWVPAVCSTGFAGYFNNLENFFCPKDKVQLTHGVTRMNDDQKTKCAKQKADQLKMILKDVNMQVLEAPYCIFENFKKSEVSNVLDITPETTFHFLRSARSQVPGRCSVSNLPQPVTNCPLKTPSNVKAVLDFLCSKSRHREIEGLPLCLRQSGNLYFFEESDDNTKPIVSKYFKLLVYSEDAFINSDIMDYFLPFSDDFHKWMKELDIPTLVRLLPHTLPKDCFRTGHPVKLQKKNLPSPHWVKNLWQFLKSKLKVEQKDSKNIVKMAEAELKDLMSWSLIPVKHHALNEETVELYPLKSRHNVVFLSEMPDMSNRVLWEVLKTQPLPFLDVSLLEFNNVVKYIVASTDHPLALLEAMSACASSLHFQANKALDILRYFITNLIGDKSFFESNKERAVDMLKSLPLYMGLDEKLRAICTEFQVLCINCSIPNEGLMEWAANDRNQKLLLLKEAGVPKELCSLLNLVAPTTFDFYEKYLLPTLQYLPGEAILKHMLLIRKELECPDHKKNSIVKLLRITPFIEVDDERYRADEFYSPHQPVFRAMVLPDDFPPAPYCRFDWKSFMELAGIVSTVSQNLFLRFAQELQNEGRSSLGVHTARKSHILSSHLFSRKDLDSHFLLNLSNIRFICPSEWERTEDGKIMIQIAKPFCSNRLISFSESCREEHLRLIWSSCCIIHPNADPRSHCLHTSFGLQTDVAKDKVIRHVLTVCNALDGSVGQRMFKDHDSLDMVKRVMATLYAYLQEHVADEDIPTLRFAAIIFDVENKQMLKPQNVVMELTEEEAIPKYIVKAPRYFGQFEDLFKKLGAAEHVSANHYARVLSELKNDAADSVLHVEEMKLLQKAVQGLFKCVQSEKEEIKRLTVDHVYLPSEEIQLVKSTQLVFVDNVGLRSRIPRNVMPVDIHFFLGFKDLKINTFLPQNVMKLLPKEHQLQFFSQVLKEVIPQGVKSCAEEGRYSTLIMDKLSKPEFVEVVVRLAFNANQKHFSESTANEIAQCLSVISVLEVADLKTVVSWQQTLLNGTDCPQTSFVDKRTDGNRSCMVYVDKQACEDRGINNHSVIKSCRIAVVHAVDISINNTSLLETALLHSPSTAQDQMDEEGLERCNFNVEVNTNRTIFPPAGTLIPQHLHCYLDSTFSSFYKGEHIGYEVYDPQVEGVVTDENVATYVYAIVVEEVSQGEVPLLRRRYRIDLGLEMGGVIEVSVTQIYKFYRRPREEPSEPLVVCESRTAPDGTSTSETPASAGSETPASPGLNFKSVMKEIGCMLIEAWETLDERGRNRVVKRLYLKWHPDKNRGNEAFCTRVVQRMQHYVNLLKLGRRLPDEEDEDDNGGRARDSASHSSSPDDFYSSFFENMHRRGHAYDSFFHTNSERNRRKYREEHFAYDSFFRTNSERNRRNYREDHFESFHSESFHAKPNPQPGEGRRWFKQAEADLENAKSTRGIYTRGYNWICFQCHQAMEKALKAVIYYNNANCASLKDHNLSVLAIATGKDVLVNLAREFEGRVGNYTQMQYPDLLSYPAVPADVYSADNASIACNVAGRVIDTVRTILQV